jgi:hypothetical protein
MRQKFISLSLAAAVALRHISAFNPASSVSLPLRISSSHSSRLSILAPCIFFVPSSFNNYPTAATATSPSDKFSHRRNNIKHLMTTDSSNDNSSNSMKEVDIEYPGTAVVRMNNVRARVKTLSEQDLTGDWGDVRRKILWAGGLKDLPKAAPGQGYTGHSFNDYNHVDLTTMNDQVSGNENDGQVRGIAIGNNLGMGIRIASIEELGPGGSWSTCSNGCNVDPPQDVAHIQFRSRIAFKLVWVPNDKFDMFVLVDDDGQELARGRPTGSLPPLRHRQMNYRTVMGSKYAKVVDQIAGNGA